MPEDRPELTPAEWDIMRVIWEGKEVIVRDVFEALGERRGWAQTTVRTMMERLARKGYLKQRKIGPVCVYRPAVARRQVVRETVRDLSARALGGGLADLLAYAVAEGEISDEELAKLERLIRDRKGKRS